MDLLHNMYLLTERKGWMGKRFAQGHDVWTEHSEVHSS